VKPRVLLDANVLYGQTPRDTFMHLATDEVIEARWTNRIHEEWISALLERRSDLTREGLEKVRALMDRHARDCLVEGYEPLTETLVLPDPDDSHVLAAAIHAQAPIIVTFNLKDFPVVSLAPFSIQAQHPDEFLCQLLRDETTPVLAAIRGQRAQLRRPPRTAEEHLETLRAHGLPRFASALEPFQPQL